MIDLRIDSRLLILGKELSFLTTKFTVINCFVTFNSFNQLDLPAYETYDKLRTYLLKAIHECSEGFGFA